jgi:hypothetical protein
MLALNAQFKEIMGEPAAKPKKVRKKKEKTLPGQQPSRKSTRVAAQVATPAPAGDALKDALTTPSATDTPTDTPMIPLVVPAVTPILPISAQTVPLVVPPPGDDQMMVLGSFSDPALSGPAPPSAPMECPAKAPDWFREVRAELMRVDLGPHFHALLNAWTRIEAASRFEHADTNLPHKGRPGQVTRWIASQRGKRVADIAVPDPVLYAKEWKTWWDFLQPKWRVRGSDERWTVGGPYGSDWEELFQWGVNGVVSLLAALYFWGSAISESPDETHTLSWLSEVEDVGWMLEGLASYYENGNWRF